LLHLADILVS